MVELLIVITIIALLLTASIASYFNQQKIQVYKGAVRHIESLLRSARSAALSGKLSDFNAEGKRVPIGVYFKKMAAAGDSGSVISFYDNDESGHYNPGDQIREDYDLPGVSILTNVQLGGSLANLRGVDEGMVAFAPPRAEVMISNNLATEVGTTSEVLLVLELSFEQDSTRKTYFTIDSRTGNINLAKSLE